jgi:hypothetical protein
MTLPNINPVTNLRYGVIDARNVPELYEQMFNEGDFDPDIEECPISFEAEGFKYELMYLGGAPLIYVMDSPFVALCGECSPCCPNAGDLDLIMPAKLTGDVDNQRWMSRDGKPLFELSRGTNIHRVSGVGLRSEHGVIAYCVQPDEIVGKEYVAEDKYKMENGDEKSFVSFDPCVLEKE